MKRLEIDEATMRQLVAEYPFYAIAQRYKCDTRTIAAFAAKYGLTSAFIAKPATAEEEARIRAMMNDGWSIKRIAAAIGRSQDFVARRVHGPEAQPDDLPERPGRWWPKPNTTPDVAMGSRLYDDMDEGTLARECPPRYLPINGAALAAAGRVRAMSHSRSAADLCVDA